MDTFITSSLISLYWLYALVSALVFWYKSGWSVLLPLLATVIGGFLFLQNPDVFSKVSQGVFMTAVFSLEVVLIKYSIYTDNPKEYIEEHEHKA